MVRVYISTSNKVRIPDGAEKREYLFCRGHAGTNWSSLSLRELHVQVQTEQKNKKQCLKRLFDFTKVCKNTRPKQNTSPIEFYFKNATILLIPHNCRETREISLFYWQTVSCFTLELITCNNESL